jgi:hypothetical protein
VKLTFIICQIRNGLENNEQLFKEYFTTWNRFAWLAIYIKKNYILDQSVTIDGILDVYYELKNIIYGLNEVHTKCCSDNTKIIFHFQRDHAA